jgi:hypothetical protein
MIWTEMVARRMTLMLTATASMNPHNHRRTIPSSATV